MLNVRSRAGVIAVTTSAAVLVGLPVVASGQVPVVEPVVNGVTETANDIVQTPSLPAAPVPAPAPAPAPAVPAPAPAPAPQVQLPAPQPAAPKPAAQAPAAKAPASGNTGSAQSHGARAGSSKRSRAGGKAAARRSAKAADRSAKRGAKRGDRAKARASGDAGSPRAEERAGGSSDVAIASQEADALPDDASPAKIPFTGLQLGLMAIAGLAALVGGMALRRRTGIVR
jgi:pyruvate dehydrogenase E2 component (dihydrolipoamide acetyltransferase)